MKTLIDKNMKYQQQITELSNKYKQIERTMYEVDVTQLQGYVRNLASLAKRYGKLRGKSSRPWTIPAIFHRDYDENFISDYLAYLLNPSRNGIGTAPLEKLLSIFNIDWGEININDVIIYREYSLENGRIDLLLEWENRLIIGIENKIFSPEGHQQTIYYHKVIDKIFNGIENHLIYLTRHGHRARSEYFNPLSYKQLHKSFCTLPIAEIPDPRKRVLWEDFLEHMEVYIIMSDPEKFEFSEKSKLYLENAAMINDLEKSFRDEWARAIEYLERKLCSQLSGGPWVTSFNPRNFSHHQVLKPTWEQSGSKIHYEYRFGPERLLKGQMAFMVEVEGKNASRILQIFDKRYSTLEAEYRQHEIQYRPRQHPDAIAWKTYDIPKDLESISSKFYEAFTEFRFLEPVIDEVIYEMTGK